eukprot:1147447-Pelagomonas_calceolata.AAC.6
MSNARIAWKATEPQVHAIQKAEINSPGGLQQTGSAGRAWWWALRGPAALCLLTHSAAPLRCWPGQTGPAAAGDATSPCPLCCPDANPAAAAAAAGDRRQNGAGQGQDAALPQAHHAAPHHCRNWLVGRGCWQADALSSSSRQSQMARTAPALFQRLHTHFGGQEAQKRLSGVHALQAAESERQ